MEFITKRYVFLGVLVHPSSLLDLMNPLEFASSLKRDASLWGSSWVVIRMIRLDGVYHKDFQFLLLCRRSASRKKWDASLRGSSLLVIIMIRFDAGYHDDYHFILLRRNEENQGQMS
ncbi:hypothetical protein NPIL_300431 [Nephila pilipes]|uniref:Uncharacterized protein n=1 Tax=Nephila pilipes TaxID=299642 RepID=A0A8X6UPA7_NEPPI|nr:hypothetical protein NPIL_300431 [Nephila pilipes]